MERNVKVENFKVSTRCIGELKRVGVTAVEEIVEFLEAYQHGTMIEAGWLKCFDEIIDELRNLGLWSEELERKWPSWQYPNWIEC